MSHGHRDSDHPDSQHEHNAHALPNISEKEKLMKLVQHWIHHNEDHAKSFREWAVRALNVGHADVARILDEVADESATQNRKLEKALELLGKSKRQPD